MEKCLHGFCRNFYEVLGSKVGNESEPGLIDWCELIMFVEVRKGLRQNYPPFCLIP